MSLISFERERGASLLHQVDTDWQSFPFWRLVSVTSGAGRFICPDREVEIREGDFFIAKPGKRQLRIHHPLRLAYIPFFLKRSLPATCPRPFPGIVRFKGMGHNRHVLEIAFQDARRAMVADAHLHRARLQVEIMMSLFMEDLDSRTDQTAAIPPGIHEAALRLATHPEERVSMHSIATRAGYSLPQFNRLFRKAYNDSPAHYAIQARINAAQRLLRNERFSVKETAFSLNYASPYDFSRQFKSEYGCSPSDYAAKTAAV